MSKSKGSTDIIYMTDKLRGQMEFMLQYPCTLIEAPMGYGKTTAVREYFKDQHMRVLWHKSFGQSIPEFWLAFCRLFGELSDFCGQSLQQIGFPTDAISSRKVVELIMTALPGEVTALVLDDYHLADSPEMNSFIEYLLWNEIPDFHIILTARFTRFAKFEELALKGYVHYIGKESLEFSAEDIIAYYNLCGVAIQPKEGQRLYAYTEGWACALYLLLLDYKKEGAFSSPSNIMKLIEKTVYQPCSEEMKEFLLCICLFDTFTPEQAAHMWQKKNTQKLLYDVTGRNALISYDEKSKAYQIHRMFLEYLRDIFFESPADEKNRLYRLAAEWHIKTGEYCSAMRCCYHIKDYDGILLALEADQGHSMHNEQRAELIKYYEETPACIRQKHPVAMLVYAICMFGFYETERFSDVCTQLATLLECEGELDNASRLALKGELELLLSVAEYNDIEKMYHHIKLAFGLLKHPAKFMDTRGGWTFGAPSVLYMFHREAGKLEASIQTMHEALPYYSKLTNGHGKGADAVIEAEKKFYTGAFDGVQIDVHKAIFLAKSAKQEDILLCAVFAQARVAAYQGEYDSAFSLIQRLRQEIEQERWFHLLHTLELCEAFLFAALGHKDRIPQWIAEGDFQSSHLLFPAMGFLNIVYGRVLLINGEYNRLLGGMDWFMETAAVYPNLLSQIYARIYEAAAYEKLLMREHTLCALKAALDMAIPDHLLMPFVENCDFIKPALNELSHHTEYMDVISSILNLYAPYQQGIERYISKRISHSKTELTGRENEIAKLVAQGLSNSEIAGRLYISTNTVKTMLKRIFEKLAINSRAMLKQHMDLQN